jgi:hypothetical protein
LTISAILITPEAATSAPASERKNTGHAAYDPATIVAEVTSHLRGQAIPVDDEPDTEKAYLAASLLLMALGIDPAPDDSAAGQLVGDALLEGRTRTTTRSRRSR